MVAIKIVWSRRFLSRMVRITVSGRRMTRSTVTPLTTSPSDGRHGREWCGAFVSRAHRGAGTFDVEYDDGDVARFRVPEIFVQQI